MYKELFEKIVSETQPDSGGWPLITSHKLENNGDVVIGSYYHGPGNPLQMPCISIKSNGRIYFPIEEGGIQVFVMKEQMVEKYQEFLENPEQFKSIRAIIK